MDLELLKQECDKRGVTMYIKYDIVYLKTAFEKFCFKNTTGKIDLKHFNSWSSCASNQYHNQFRRYITEAELAAYVDEHTRAKYTRQYVKFSVQEA